MNKIEDTGNRRRLIDMVSTDDCLELVCTLAYEKALEGKDPAVISQVETAMLKLRALKHELTGAIPILSPDDIVALETAQEAEDARIGILTTRLELARDQYANGGAKDHLERKMKAFAVELRDLGELVPPVPGEENYR